MPPERIWTDETLAELGEELIEYMSQDGVWHISEFTDYKKKDLTWIYELARRYRRFTPYLTKTQRLIGRKMFKYGMEKNPNAWMLKTFMPRFLGVRDIVYEELEKEETIKAKAKISALKDELNSMGEIAEFIKMQKELNNLKQEGVSDDSKKDGKLGKESETVVAPNEISNEENDEGYQEQDIL